MTDCLISVIVPVYKVENYLRQCLDSIINQTYKNLEIILVDDGSPDNCPKICDEYAKNDKRIKVIHKENGGLSSARNAGLDVCTGEYISFIDSDDIVDKNFIERMYTKSKEYRSDICICNYAKFSDDENIGCFSKEEKNTVLSSEIVQEKMLEKNAVLYIIMWNKLFKRYIFDCIRFPLGKINEDEAVIHYIYDRCKSDVLVINNILYFYRFNESSITNRKFSATRLDAMDAMKDRIEFYKRKNNNHLYELSLIKYEYVLKRLYILTYKNVPNSKSYLKRIISEYRTVFKECKNNSQLSFDIRMKFLVFYLFPNAFSFFINEDKV